MRALAPLSLAATLLFFAPGTVAIAQGSDQSLTGSQTVSEYLTLCARDTSVCYTDVAAWATNNDDKHCIPGNLGDKKLARAVIDWLRDHPEKSSADPYDSIKVASAAIWSCPTSL